MRRRSRPRRARGRARIDEIAGEAARQARRESLGIGHLETPAEFICPITLAKMADPVVASDGHSYERSAIERWLTTNDTSPMTGAALKGTDVVPNHALRNSILEHFQAGGRELSPLHPLPPQAAAPRRALPQRGGQGQQEGPPRRRRSSRCRRHVHAGPKPVQV